jgi:hypothetical protein
MRATPQVSKSGLSADPSEPPSEKIEVAVPRRFVPQAETMLTPEG